MERTGARQRIRVVESPLNRNSDRVGKAGHQRRRRKGRRTRILKLRFQRFPWPRSSQPRRLLARNRQPGCSTFSVTSFLSLRFVSKESRSLFVETRSGKNEKAEERNETIANSDFEEERRANKIKRNYGKRFRENLNNSTNFVSTSLLFPS